MLALSRHRTRARRGIVLVLVLAMLGLLALIGITFATYTGQSRINARNYAQSVLVPQKDELIDFALSQLITDTGDARSAIRGHSLARDMYGNDANHNGFLAANPANGAVLLLTAPPLPVAGTPFYDVQTNIPIPANAPALYGYDFTRWIMRMSYVGPVHAGNGQAVGQTFEILIDDFAPNGTRTQYSGQGVHALRISPIDPAQTMLINPTQGTTTQGALSQYLSGIPTYGNLNNYPFVLDGRWLRAFNGPGLGSVINPVTGVPNSVYGNFRYNGDLLAGAQFPRAIPGIPGAVGMDEDYDACD